MRCSIYDFKNAELLGFHTASRTTGHPQLLPQKVPEALLVWLPI